MANASEIPTQVRNPKLPQWLHVVTPNISAIAISDWCHSFKIKNNKIIKTSEDRKS